MPIRRRADAQVQVIYEKAAGYTNGYVVGPGKEFLSEDAVARGRSFELLEKRRRVGHVAGQISESII